MKIRSVVFYVKLLTVTDKQRDRQTDRHTERQIDRQTDKRRVKHNLLGGCNNEIIIMLNNSIVNAFIVCITFSVRSFVCFYNYSFYS